MKILGVFAIVLMTHSLIAQHKRHLRNNDTTDITFTGTKINPYSLEYDSTGHFSFSGYIDTYYAYYTDTVGLGGFQKFPTISPRSDQFGINMLQLSTKYNSKLFRGTVTLFGGDCPLAAWSTHLNYVQEANVGFRIIKRLWLDAGFFRTHFGLESIQPRENITMSIATTTYFEPYFLSGAKLTWQQSEKLAIQINAFNSFNQYIETNKNKAIGLSIAYQPTAKLNTTFSTIVCDESATNSNYKRTRIYNNFISTYKSTHWVIGIEGNFGSQRNSVLTDSSKTAFMFSSLIAAKYRITPKWAVFSRAELYSDPNEILTGPIVNQNHQLVGMHIGGMTFGVEFKPIPNSYLRIESRYLQTKLNEKIFYYNNQSHNSRLEFNVGLGLWF